MKHKFQILALALFTAFTAQATVIELNSTCPIASPCDANAAQSNPLTYGQSTGQTSFAFNYTAASGDLYNVSGSYFASYAGTANQFGVLMNVIYANTNPGASVATDNLNFDFFQSIYDNGPGTFNGTYTEAVPITLSSNATLTTNLFYDSQAVGQLLFTGPGTFSKTTAANLTGLTGNFLSEDFQFDFTFAAGTAPGAGGQLIANAPEPAETIPAAIVLTLCATLVVKRRTGLAKVSNR